MGEFVVLPREGKAGQRRRWNREEDDRAIETKEYEREILAPALLLRSLPPRNQLKRRASTYSLSLSLSISSSSSSSSSLSLSFSLYLSLILLSLSLSLSLYLFFFFFFFTLSFLLSLSLSISSSSSLLSLSFSLSLFSLSFILSIFAFLEGFLVDDQDFSRHFTSFYVGDAAGRKYDHSDADIEFAKVRMSDE